MEETLFHIQQPPSAGGNKEIIALETIKNANSYVRVVTSCIIDFPPVFFKRETLYRIAYQWFMTIARGVVNNFTEQTSLLCCHLEGREGGRGFRAKGGKMWFSPTLYLMNFPKT